MTYLLPTLWGLSIIFCARCSESNISREMHISNGTLVTHELLETHFTTQNNLAPVMLCQYLLTEDKCCYCFVISALAGDLGSAVPISAAKECQLIWGHSEKSTIFLGTDKQRWWIFLRLLRRHHQILRKAKMEANTRTARRRYLFRAGEVIETLVCTNIEHETCALLNSYYVEALCVLCYWFA